MDIRPLCAADLEPLAAAVQRGGWGDLRRQLAFYLAYPDCHPFLAVIDAAPAGTTTAVRKADVGWLAHVFVAPEYRGRGLGSALVRRAVEELETLGCRTVLLAATAIGRVIGAYVPTPWDGGPIVSATPEAGRRLLELRRGMAGCSGLSELNLPLPAANPAARDYLLATGFREQRRTTRMRRGAPVAWRPEAVWGVFSLRMG